MAKPPPLLQTFAALMRLRRYLDLGMIYMALSKCGRRSLYVDAPFLAVRCARGRALARILIRNTSLGSVTALTSLTAALNMVHPWQLKLWVVACVARPLLSRSELQNATESSLGLACVCSPDWLSGVLSIASCGALPMASSVKVAKRNGRALACALETASTGDTVVVPYGSRWYVIPDRGLNGLAQGVTLRIDGELVAHDIISAWPRDGRTHLSLIKVSNASNFTIEGKGAINGQGHSWWWHFVRPGSTLRSHKRPILIELDDCDDVTVRDLALLDAPRFNVYLGGLTRRARVTRLSIIVDWRKQRRLLIDAAKRRSSIGWAIERAWISWFRPAWWSFPLPMFPFNTDGIDVAGADVIVEHIVVSNWDDVVAVKPSELLSPPASVPAIANWGDWCTRNVMIRNVTTLFGGGISVGSVHPSEKLPCVKDVVFKNIEMFRPVKGPYVKPDLAPDYCARKQNCAALIANVTFENVDMLSGGSPTWWRRFEREQRSRGGASIDPRQPRANWQRLRQRQGRLIANSLSKFIAWLTRPAEASPVCRARWFVNVLCFSWPIYIGTQQQEEPGGAGNGLWPRTEPLCTVVNVTLRSIRARGGVWPQSAAAIRCNSTNPCTGIHLENVSIRGKFDTSRRWICDDDFAAYGTSAGVVEPRAKSCIKSIRQQQTAPPATLDDSRRPYQLKYSLYTFYVFCALIVVTLGCWVNTAMSSSVRQPTDVSSSFQPPHPASTTGWGPHPSSGGDQDRAPSLHYGTS